MDATNNVYQGSVSTQHRGKRVLLASLIATVAALGSVPSAHAVNNSTDQFNQILGLIFFSTQEPINPEYAGFVTVSFTQPLDWSIDNGACNLTTVAIRPEDKHLIAAVQTAYASDRPLRVFVDDIQKVPTSNVCILRAVQY